MLPYLLRHLSGREASLSIVAEAAQSHNNFMKSNVTYLLDDFLVVIGDSYGYYGPS
jgi:hypothetical protein